MKFSLPLKLAVFVIVLFSVLTAACLLWTPLRVRYYTAKLESDNPKECVAGVDGLLGMGKKGVDALETVLDVSKEEAEFLAGHWKDFDKVIPGEEMPGTRGVEVRCRPIHFAAARGYFHIVEIFLCKGEDAAVRDNTGWEPMHWAAYKGHKNIVVLLWKNGGNIDHIPLNGWPPLHLSAANGHIDITKYLLEKGLDINSRHTDNTTPLHGAAWNGESEMVAFLLSRGCEINVLDDKSQTPIDYVIDSGYKDIEKLLRKHGAKTGAELKTNEEGARWSILYYITDADRKYHSNDCSLVKDNSRLMTLEEVKKEDYKPCEKCKPPK
ncbi:MAG: ankyrin repeat domain-containing protein [Planctomycetota bacterium]|jgi:hypothetical protein